MCNCKNGIVWQVVTTTNVQNQTQATSGTVVVPIQTDILLITTASQTGSLVYYGQVQIITATDTCQITVTPVVGGIANSASALIANVTFPIGGPGNVVIPISDLQAITAGDTFEIRIESSDYAADVSASVRVNYNYQ